MIIVELILIYLSTEIIEKDPNAVDFSDIAEAAEEDYDNEGKTLLMETSTCTSFVCILFISVLCRLYRSVYIV